MDAAVSACAFAPLDGEQGLDESVDMGPVQSRIHPSVLLFVTLPMACVEPYKPADEGSPDCVAILNEVCGGTEGDDEAGGSETGDTAETGDEEPVPLDPGACVANPNPDVIGYRHQCEGTVDYTVEFNISFLFGEENCNEVQNLSGPPLCNESHVFGDEPYEQSHVAACCGPYDGNPASDAVYLSYCEADLANQLCHTLVDRLEYHLDNNHFAGFETQAQSLIAYVASENDLCTGAFVNNDIDDDPAHLESHYTVPDMAAWDVFQNFTITVDIGNITAFSIPEDPADWIECYGMQGNDGYPFPISGGDVGGGDSIDTILASAMKVELAGPILFGSPVEGAAEMGSRASQCAPPWCSRASFARDGAADELAITQMTLFAGADVTVANKIGAQTLTDVRIELAHGVEAELERGATGGRAVYVIEPGNAFFWVVGGAVDDTAGSKRFLVESATTIVMSPPSGGAWQVSGFDLETIDIEGRRWTLGVPASTWQ